MSCRETAGNSAMVSIATMTEGVDEHLVQQTFHRLRREGYELGAAMTDPADAVEVQGVVEQAKWWVRHDDRLSEARKASIIARLDRAAADAATGKTPDRATLHAWRNLQSAAAATAAARAERQRVLADRAERLRGLAPEVQTKTLELWQASAGFDDDTAVQVLQEARGIGYMAAQVEWETRNSPWMREQFAAARQEADNAADAAHQLRQHLAEAEQEIATAERRARSYAADYEAVDRARQDMARRWQAADDENERLRRLLRSHGISPD